MTRRIRLAWWRMSSSNGASAGASRPGSTSAASARIASTQAQAGGAPSDSGQRPTTTRHWLAASSRAKPIDQAGLAGAGVTGDQHHPPVGSLRGLGGQRRAGRSARCPGRRRSDVPRPVSAHRARGSGSAAWPGRTGDRRSPPAGRAGPARAARSDAAGPGAAPPAAAQHIGFDLQQRRARVHPQLVGEDVPRPPQRGQRVRLPTARRTDSSPAVASPPRAAGARGSAPRRPSPPRVASPPRSTASHHRSLATIRRPSSRAASATAHDSVANSA